MSLPFSPGHVASVHSQNTPGGMERRRRNHSRGRRPLFYSRFVNKLMFISQSRCLKLFNSRTQSFTIQTSRKQSSIITRHMSMLAGGYAKSYDGTCASANAVHCSIIIHGVPLMIPMGIPTPRLRSFYRQLSESRALGALLVIEAVWRNYIPCQMETTHQATRLLAGALNGLKKPRVIQLI